MILTRSHYLDREKSYYLLSDLAGNLAQFVCALFAACSVVEGVGLVTLEAVREYLEFTLPRRKSLLLITASSSDNLGKTDWGITVWLQTT